MLRKVWRKHQLSQPTKIKLGRYYKGTEHILCEEQTEDEPDPQVYVSISPIIEVIEEYSSLKLEQYQTSSTAFTTSYYSETVVEPTLQTQVISECAWGCCLYECYSVTVEKPSVVVEEEQPPEQTKHCEVAQDTELLVETWDWKVVEPLILQVPSSVDSSEEEDLQESSSEEPSEAEAKEEEVLELKLETEPMPRMSLKVEKDVTEWDHEAWVNAYRRMTSILVLPRPPLESVEPAITILETDFMLVLFNFPPIFGFYGVDYDDTWNRAARTIQRLFKKGYFLKLIAKVTRMNRELKRAEEITQNRKRRRLALKM